MGKRPLNTTKSGKYMNPADQARKHARQKELKKNKKQRVLMRNVLLKSQNPKKIINEMDILDDMEYNVDQKPLYREPVIQDKRKKLLEMFEKVIKLYEKENPVFYAEIKKLKRDYDYRRHEKVRYYESIRNTKNVNLESIPLPESEEINTFYTQPPIYNPFSFFSNPFMMYENPYLSLQANQNMEFPQLKSILKSSNKKSSKVTPGPPINDIMPLSPLSKVDSDNRSKIKMKVSYDSDSSSHSRTPSPPSLGNNFDKMYHEDNQILPPLPDEVNEGEYEEIIAQDISQPEIAIVKKKIRFEESVPPPPPSLSTSNFIDFELRANKMAPPLIPPMFYNNPHHLAYTHQIVAPPKIDYSYNPSAISSIESTRTFTPKNEQINKIEASHNTNATATNQEKNIVIQAKPQLRSLTEESLKFMPTSLLVKRNASNKEKSSKSIPFYPRKMNRNVSAQFVPTGKIMSGQQHYGSEAAAAAHKTNLFNNLQEKDDAYATFMKELEGFL